MTAPKLLCAFILAAILPVTAQAGSGSYGVPPSPYGQVGNPYLAPIQAPIASPPPAAVPYTVAHASAPAPAKPALVAVVQPVRPAPKPLPAPAPQAVANAAPDDGYQVPATSKYAARINAARAAAGAAASTATTATAADAATTTPTTTTPVAAADHVFVPGEHYTDASEAPRVYSLHRQWGLTPDKIETDHVATGALLTLTDVPGSGTATPTDKDNSSTEDDGAEAPNTAKTATP